MANSGSIWGGKLLVRRCPEFRSLAYEDQCLIHWCKIYPSLDVISEKLTAWLTSMILLPTPLSFLTFFLLFGAFELVAFWQCIFFFLQNWTYLFLLLYLPGVQIKLMNSFIFYLKLDQLSRLNSLTGFYSLI